MEFKAYIGICRFDHWVKNIFILPGILFGMLFKVGYEDVYFNHAIILDSFIVFISTGLAASANYTINEFLDSEFDKTHPTKKTRAGAMGKLNGFVVIIQWLILSIISLVFAWSLNRMCFYSVILLLVMGVIYNVPPIRSKDHPYIDVLSESINNPIRFVIGWSVFFSEQLPPGSILICYWMGGAYLMALKRFAELRMIDDKNTAGSYRKSFRFYTELKLLESAILYATISVFFLGIFLIKYRIEYIITSPILAALYAYYFKISFDNDSTVAAPEKLHQDKTLMIISSLLVVMFLIASFVTIPQLHKFLLPISF